ncbi:MAG: pantothenate kinase [Oscillatoria sp. PMC 1051.18]|nr:pantothenate kinase [Oscillatoria sp. PMC 1050.18]MEC5031780.1 pantothenate kinase [Oscillatoria sp. PMC 1051.18]
MIALARFNNSQDWIALAIGNSRLHWGRFRGVNLLKTWDTEYLTQPVVEDNLPVCLASVVPSQTQLWEIYPQVEIIKLEHIPLKGVYPTMGCDRALALWGAIQTYNPPVLVVDAGTALTFTGANCNSQFVGGAILPGLSSQFYSLATKTAALPQVEFPAKLPSRWANDTRSAIASGILYTTLAGIKDYLNDWWDLFPKSQVIFTGGDYSTIRTYLQELEPKIAEKILVDAELVFWGMRSLVVKNY